jgi:hypothetical protein
MIRARDILTFLEDWLKIRGKQVEIIENPMHWRDVVSDLKDELRELKRIGGAPVFRFFYYEKGNILKVWIGFWAVHVDVIKLCPTVNDMECWYGWIDTVHRIAEVTTPNGSEDPDHFVETFDELPIRLQKFLSGLKLGDGNYIDSPERF